MADDEKKKLHEKIDAAKKKIEFVKKISRAAAAVDEEMDHEKEEENFNLNDELEKI